MLYYPNPILLQPSKRVTNIVPAVSSLIEHMKQEMQAYKGVGLAAIQVGAPFQIMLVENDVIIDPVILDQSKGENTAEEGCLSVPQMFTKVSRPNTVMFMCMEENGESNIKSYSGVKARIFFHELDHLNGKFFFDRVSRSKRKKLLKEYALSS